MTSETIRGRGRRRQAAFSLIELLLVLVILAVLAAVIVPKFTNRSEQARLTAAKTDISMLETALDSFEIDNGRFPTTEEGLDALVRAPSSLPDWKGPYIKRGSPLDPWGQAYVYRYPGTNNENGYDLSSLGPDKREGNDDPNNWAKQ
jgi:general secretion pathway protein G